MKRKVEFNLVKARLSLLRFATTCFIPNMLCLVLGTFTFFEGEGEKIFNFVNYCHLLAIAHMTLSQSLFLRLLREYPSLHLSPLMVTLHLRNIVILCIYMLLSH